MMAVRADDKDIIELLIDGGSDPSVWDNNGQSAIDLGLDPAMASVPLNPLRPSSSLIPSITSSNMVLQYIT
jgi:hypothetical protein